MNSYAVYAKGTQESRDELNKRCAALLKEVEQQDELIALYEKRMTSYQKELAEARAALEIGELEKKTAQAEIDKYALLVKTTQEALDIAKKRGDDLREELEKVRKQRDDAIRGQTLKIVAVAAFAFVIGILVRSAGDN